MVYIILAKALAQNNFNCQIFDSANGLPMVYPFILSLFKYTTLSIAKFGQLLNLIFGTLVVLLTYRISLKVFNDLRSAIFTAFLTAITPILIKTSSVPMRDIPALLLGTLSIYCLAKFYISNSKSLLFVSGLFTSLTVMTRLEYLDLFLAISIFLVLNTIIKNNSFTRKIEELSTLIPYYILGFLIATFLIQIYFSSKGFTFNLFDNFSSYLNLIDLKERTSQLRQNINNATLNQSILSLSNFYYFVVEICKFSFPMVFIFAIPGIIVSMKNILKNKLSLFLFIYFLISLIIRFLHYNAWHILIGRYCLLLVVTLIIFAGYGLNFIYTSFNKYLKKKAIVSILLTVFVIGSAFISFKEIYKPWNRSWIPQIGKLINNKSNGYNIILTNFPDTRLGYYSNAGLYFFNINNFSLTYNYTFFNNNTGNWNTVLDSKDIKIPEGKSFFYRNLDNLNANIYIVYYGFKYDDLKVIFESSAIPFKFNKIKEISSNGIDIVVCKYLK